VVVTTRMEINVIEKQKWKIILEMLWLAYHNPEIDWKTREVKKKKKPKRERTMEMNKVAEELEI